MEAEDQMSQESMSTLDQMNLPPVIGRSGVHGKVTKGQVLQDSRSCAAPSLMATGLEGTLSTSY